MKIGMKRKRRMQMSSTGYLVAAIANSYLGARKGDKRHKAIIAKYNEIKPYGYTMSLSDPWCAAFWTACQIMAGNTFDEVPMSASCSKLIERAKQLGIWVENEANTPKVGYGVLYDWQDSGVGDNKGAPDHVGIARSITGNNLAVIEGNKGSDSIVGVREIKVNGRYLRGYIAPKYAVQKKSTYKPTTLYDGDIPSKDVLFGSSGTDTKKLQKFLNWVLGIKLNGKGKCGKETTQAIIDYQYTYSLEPDGCFGPKCRDKAISLINKYNKANYLAPWYDAMEKQYKWSKDQNYKWVTPTIKSSRKNGTCITFVAVSLQRLKLLPSGGYVFYDPKTKKLAGSMAYIRKHKDVFKWTYSGKLWKDCKLKKGDICCFDSHTMVYMGMDSKGRARWNTMGSKKRGLSILYPIADKRKVRAIIRLKKVTL